MSNRALSSIEEAKKSKYVLFPTKRKDYFEDMPIITIIIDCYYGLHYVKKSIQSVLDQSYHNVEIVLVDNGSKKEVSDYLNYIYSLNSNTVLIVFKENQFSFDDTQKTVAICWNVALLHSSGDYVGHLSYDDMLSSNCAERMVKLFIDNDDCITASPLPVSIKEDDTIDKEVSHKLYIRNKRAIYMRGTELALDFITGGNNNFFSAPGGIMFTKRDVLLKYGGFDRSSDITQIIKFAIHGDSGFDKKATLFWRHHKNQLNNQLKGAGIVWCGILSNTIINENIVNFWREIFTEKQVELLHKYVENYEKKSVIQRIDEGIKDGGIIIMLKILIGILKKCRCLMPYVIKILFVRFFRKLNFNI